MVCTHRKGSLAFVLAALVTVTGAARGDWPCFRGPNHDGISDATGFKTSWAKAIPIVWERTVGSGFSSFACVGDKVYTCGTQAQQQVVFCFNADKGDVIWQQPIEPEFRESSGGDGPRATPTVDDGRVYVLGAQGTLLCLDAGTGSALWKTRLREPPRWGFSGSVLIEGDLAIASGGGRTFSVSQYQ